MWVFYKTGSVAEVTKELHDQSVDGQPEQAIQAIQDGKKFLIEWLNLQNMERNVHVQMMFKQDGLYCQASFR